MQFECEVAGERIRSKIEAPKPKGMWMGDTVSVTKALGSPPPAGALRACDASHRLMHLRAANLRYGLVRGSPLISEQRFDMEPIWLHLVLTEEPRAQQLDVI